MSALVTSDPPFTLLPWTGLRLQVLRPPRFLQLVAAVQGRPTATAHYRYLWHTEGETVVLSVSPHTPWRWAEMDRDSAWGRRRELAGELGRLLSPFRPDPRQLNHHIPLALLTPLTVAALEPGRADPSAVLRAFTRNSQARFEEVAQAFLSGCCVYDSARYARTGPAADFYSHTDHLGWVYARQIACVLRWLAESPGPLTVVDLGTGGGHFLLTLAAVLRSHGRSDRVRLVGIDRTDRDLRYGRELSDEAGLRVEFRQHDLTAPHFADDLRRLRADVIVCNHVLEHLAGDADALRNHHLTEWVLAAGLAVSVSVPLRDEPQHSLSDHRRAFDATGVEALAGHLEIRSSLAVRALDLADTRDGGLLTLVRASDVRERGGFSGAVVEIVPRPTAPADHPLLADFKKPFDPVEFRGFRRAPVVGRVSDRARFEKAGGEPRQVRQLVIKVPGSKIRLPAEFAQVGEAVEIMAGHNRTHNPDYDAGYAYLTVSRGPTECRACRGSSPSPSCHCDQLQTLRPGFAYQPDWSYIVSNTLPTTLFAHGFAVEAAVAAAGRGERVNLYDCLNRQAVVEEAYHSENFGVLLLSPYVVQAASEAPAGVFRVFCKVAFSTKRFFDNRELRRNPAFDTDDWYEQDTVGYADGFLHHAHWHQRFLAADLFG